MKLTRVVLLAPLVAGVGVATRRRGTAAPISGASSRRPPLVPLFVVGFLAAIAVTSAGVLPTAVVHGATTVQADLLTAALFGLGTSIHVGKLVRTGSRSLLLALASWVLVAGVAYAGVRLVGG